MLQYLYDSGWLIGLTDNSQYEVSNINDWEQGEIVSQDQFKIVTSGTNERLAERIQVK